MSNLMRFTLSELCRSTGVSMRNVRYYIQQGLVDPANGAGRGAWYGGNHVEQLVVIRRLQADGFSLDGIRQLLQSKDPDAVPPPSKSTGGVEVWSHIHIRDGVELHIQPGRAAFSPKQLRLLREKLLETLDKIK